jgi:RecG-like helicase
VIALAKRWRGWTRSRTAAEASELQDEMRAVGVEPIRECHHGARVSVAGTVRVVTLRPKQLTPALEIELYDGSGYLTVIWLGRRRITGITTGRRMIISGRLTCSPAARVIYNPSYELLPMAV